MKIRAQRKLRLLPGDGPGRVDADKPIRAAPKGMQSVIGRIGKPISAEKPPSTPHAGEVLPYTGPLANPPPPRPRPRGLGVAGWAGVGAVVLFVLWVIF